MASLAFPRSVPHLFRPNRLPADHRRNQCVCRLSSAVNETSTAVVWFKHDLRLDDHPGLVAASKCRALVPLYVFDRRILSRYTDETLELAIIALEELRKSLREQGSNLMIRFGEAENVIEELVKEVRATDVFAEEEVEYDLCKNLDVVKKKLEGIPFPGGRPRIVVWRTPFYESQNSMELPQSWEEFKKLELSLTLPVPAASLPSSGSELHWGSVPTLDDLRDYMEENPCKKENSWMEMKRASAESVLRVRLGKVDESSMDLSIDGTTGKRAYKSAFVTRKRDIVGGGTNDVLNALAAYLRYLEGTARDDWQEVHAKLRDAEIRRGASFFKLFGPALCLGIISRRRVHHEAIKYEKERNAGFLSPFGYSAATLAAATDAVRSMEWYSLMALKSLSDETRHSVRIWRWKGYLIQYTVVGDEGPAVLLVHGFGAFLEHYRDNADSIANSRNRVWVITVLGFGKSEKPNIVYTELLWAELLRDFVIEVVGETVHCVGNSIGGYFVALTACLWPGLVKSVVLVNSAGDVIPGYSPLPISRDRRPPAGAWLGARLLLLYLRLNAQKLLKDCYPVKPERADDFLISEMLRASRDPGVLVVLESIFGFDLSVPLNFILKGLEDRVLVVQGMRDPISDSHKKVALLKEHCPRIAIKKVDAGHCPHDEIPEEINPIMCEWITNIESKPAIRVSSQQINT